MKLFKKENYYLGFTGVAGFIIIWEIVSRLRLVSPILVSSPEAVLNSEIELFATGAIFPHLFQSLSEVIVGLTLAIFLGVLFGFIIGRFSRLEKVVHPLVYALYSTPAIAIFPLILIWLGFSLWTKVAIVFLASFFPIVINTTAAVKNLDPNFIRLAKSFEAYDFDIFKSITLPSSLPFIISGIRIAVPRSITGMVVAEFFASNAGLGHLISYFGATFQTEKFLAVVFIIIVLSVALTSIIGFFEKRTQNWKPEKTTY